MMSNETQNQEMSFSFPALSRVEAGLFLVGSILFIFRFLKIPGINFGFGDILFCLAGTSYLLRSGKFPIAPNRLTSVGIFLFLSMITLSILWTPILFEGIKHTLQYYLIFLVVIPMTLLVYRIEYRRQLLFSLLTGIFSIIILGSAIEIVLTEPHIQKYSPKFLGFAWGKQNNYHWMLAVGVIFTACWTVDPNKAIKSRYLSLVLTLTGVIIVIYGMTLSAILALAIGMWTLTLVIIRIQNYIYTEKIFWLATTIALFAAVVISIQYIEIIHREGALYSRLPMYKEAFEEGVRTFPFGHGIGSSRVALNDLPEQIPRVTHNFVLHYLLTIGVGVFGFLAVLVAWLSAVFHPILRQCRRFPIYDISFAITFLMYLSIAFFQPPPVHRFWWLLFGVSWAAIISQRMNGKNCIPCRGKIDQ